uniref:Ada2b tri-helical domain-containing protein n=1 Tax=Megaselia scalaris TaxID=36166 RepID=T1GGB3_MEGSC
MVNEQQVLYDNASQEINKLGNQVDTFSPFQHKVKMEEPDVKRENSSSIEPKHMLPIGDRTYSDGLSPSKNFSDNYRGLSGHQMIVLSPTTTTQLTAVNNKFPANSTTPVEAATTTSLPLITLIQNSNGNIKLGEDEKRHILQQRLARKQVQLQQQHHQQQHHQHPQQQTNEVLTNDIISIFLKNQLTLKQQQIPQNEENLLTHNEIKLCSKLNILPSEYISMKTVLL